MIRPINRRVLVKPQETTGDRLTTGGIIVPTTAEESLRQGTVLAVGYRNVRDDKVGLEVQVGDIVLFPAHAGTVVKVEDVEHLMLDEDSILGVVEP